MTQPTVRDVWRLALPSGSQLYNERGDLDRPVVWTHRMAAHPPAFATLEHDEIVLITIAHLPLLDDRLTLETLMAGLAEKRTAALAVIGGVTDTDVRAADTHGICLLKLPDDADMRAVERDIIRLIVEREAQLDRRGREVYRQIAQSSIENQGLRAVAETLHRIVQKVVLIQDEGLQIAATAPESEAKALLATSGFAHALLAHAPNQDGCPLDDKAPPCRVEHLAGPDLHRCVATIVVEGQLGGYVSIVTRDEVLDELDQLAAERCALVCAMEVAKQRAVVAAELRLRGDFLNALLTAGAAEETALTQRATEMGYKLDGDHLAFFVDLQEVRPGAQGLVANELRTRLSAHGVDFLFCAAENRIAVLCRTTETLHVEDLEVHAKAALHRIIRLAPDIHITIGLGRRGAGLSGLRRSLIQARETLDLARHLGHRDAVLAFGDLALYHLLQRLGDTEELSRFEEEALGALAVYDSQHDAALLSTLTAYFQHHGNVSQTADSLHLHRNSLIYRLERIAAITGRDLNDAEDRFALQLALKLRAFFLARQ